MIYKVVIALCFKLCIQMLSEPVAAVFKCLMKMNRILLKQIIRRKVCTATKPTVAYFSIFIIYLEIPEICVNGRNHRIVRMEYQRNTAGKKFLTLNVQLLLDGRSNFTKHFRGVNTSLFKYRTILYYPCYSATAF